MILSTLFVLSAHAGPFDGPDLPDIGPDLPDGGVLDPGAELGDPEPEADPEVDTAPELPTQVSLFAVVDARRLDELSRESLGLADTGPVYIYAMGPSEVSDTWIVYREHPHMQFWGIDQHAIAGAPASAVLTSEAWASELLVGIAAPPEEQGHTFLIDGEYASEDLRYASGHPDAPSYVVSPDIVDSPAFREGMECYVAPASPTATWDEFRDYAMAGATPESAIGITRWSGGDTSEAWRGPIEVGAYWHDAVYWTD